MKIIRVTGCHDCLHAKQSNNMIMCYCNEDSHVEFGDITTYYITKTLPANCPLEEVEDFIANEVKNLGAY